MFVVSDLLRDLQKICFEADTFYTPLPPPPTELGLSCFPIGNVNEILTSITQYNYLNRQIWQKI
jgi:hypothetical protein